MFAESSNHAPIGWYWWYSSSLNRSRLQKENYKSTKWLTFFEVFQDVIVQVDVDLCLLQFDIFGKLLNNELFALFSIIHAACHHFWSWYLTKWYFIMNLRLAWIKIDTSHSPISSSVHPLLSLGIVDWVLKIDALLLYLLLLLKLLVNLLSKLKIKFCTIR